MIEDWEINCQVRAYLVKWWIDIKKLDIRTIGGVVYIKGSIRFKETARLEEDEKPNALLHIERDLHKMQGVKDVKLQFTNWAKHEDEWVRTKEQ
jgi:hypothetical protein